MKRIQKRLVLVPYSCLCLLRQTNTLIEVVFKHKNWQICALTDTLAKLEKNK